MSLTTAERAELSTLASTPPASGSAIQHLTSMYRRFAAGGAAEVSEVIANATGDGALSPSYFSGFIAGTDSRGFRSELTDPLMSNPQTGHFFSYVVWALDGISFSEYAAAIGHELFPDPLDDALHSHQIGRGLPNASAFSSVVQHQPTSATAVIDYLALDVELDRHGWNATTLEPWLHSWLPTWHMDDGWQYRDLYTGNSIQDLRCTVAGLVLGRAIQLGHIRDAGQVADWLAANVLAQWLASALAQPATSASSAQPLRSQPPRSVPPG